MSASDTQNIIIKLIDEVQKVGVEVQKVGSKLDAHTQLMEEKQKNQDGRLDVHDKELWGKNGDPGMKMELHSLKFKEEERSKKEDKTNKIQLATITAVVGLGAKSLWEWITKGAHTP